MIFSGFQTRSFNLFWPEKAYSFVSVFHALDVTHAIHTLVGGWVPDRAQEIMQDPDTMTGAKRSIPALERLGIAYRR